MFKLISLVLSFTILIGGGAMAVSLNNFHGIGDGNPQNLVVVSLQNHANPSSQDEADLFLGANGYTR